VKRQRQYPTRNVGKPGHSPQEERPEVRLTRLITRTESNGDQPTDRMNLAQELFDFANDSEVRALPHLRLRALTRAVRLDPFRRAFRLEFVRELRSLGLANDAIAELRSAEQAGFELDDDEKLEHAYALLENGEIEKACNRFKVIGAETLRLQADFGLIECDLRSADSPEEWKCVLDKLAGLKLPENCALHDQAVGLFLEKCLKFAAECADRDTVTQLARVVERKVGSPKNSLPPVYSLFLSLARSSTNGQAPSGTLDGLLFAYRLTKQLPAAGSDSDRIEVLKRWRQLVATDGGHWFGLREAYLHILDSWALEGYRRKEFELARSLWSEAERIAPSSPRVIKNLALVSTRAGDESGSAWYWDRVTRVWNFYSEMAPEADGYLVPLLQKSQAFAECAEKKLLTAKTSDERLEVAEILAREALTYLVLRQSGFRNPLLRCGALEEDYSNEAERDECLTEGHKSLQRGLKLIAEWQHLGEDSELQGHRLVRINEALHIAKSKGAQKFAFYKQEHEAFVAHRKTMARHFLNLISLLRELSGQEFSEPLFPPFNVLREASLTSPEAAALDSDDVRRNKDLAAARIFPAPPKSDVRLRMMIIASATVSFPFGLLKPEALRMVRDLTKDTDLRRLAEDAALGPWLAHARQRMLSKDYFEAGSVLEEALAIAPNSALLRFFLAQCHAMEERFARAYSILLEARDLCTDEELRIEIDKFADHMDFKRVDQSLANAKGCLKNDDSGGAVRECSMLKEEFGHHPYFLFVLAQAYAANLDFPEANSTLIKAHDALTSDDDSELSHAIRNFKEQVEHSPHLMVLSKAVPLMQKERWEEAAKVLARGRTLELRNPRVTFYEAVSIAHSGQTEQAERIAQEAIEQCNALLGPKKTQALANRSSEPTDKERSDADDARKLVAEIKAFVPQIQSGVIFLSREAAKLLAQANEAASGGRLDHAIELARAAVDKGNQRSASVVKKQLAQLLTARGVQTVNSASAKAERAAKKQQARILRCMPAFFFINGTFGWIMPALSAVSGSVWTTTIPPKASLWILLLGPPSLVAMAVLIDPILGTGTAGTPHSIEVNLGVLFGGVFLLATIRGVVRFFVATTRQVPHLRPHYSSPDTSEFICDLCFSEPNYKISLSRGKTRRLCETHANVVESLLKTSAFSSIAQPAIATAIKDVSEALTLDPKSDHARSTLKQLQSMAKGSAGAS